MLFMNEDGAETVGWTQLSRQVVSVHDNTYHPFYTSAFFNGVRGDGAEVQKWKFREVEIRSVSSEGDIRGEKKIQSKCFLVFQFARIFFDTRRAENKPDDDKSPPPGQTTNVNCSLVRRYENLRAPRPPPQNRTELLDKLYSPLRFCPFFLTPFVEEIAPLRSFRK